MRHCAEAPGLAQSELSSATCFPQLLNGSCESTSLMGFLRELELALVKVCVLHIVRSKSKFTPGKVGEKNLGRECG